jgi:O-acetyl-ADP-ribose deacetylase
MSVADRIEVARADITQERVDAIVNAANVNLAHGGGVARAISSAAGPELQSACDRLIASRGPLETGEAVATDGFQLPCLKVIHTVGPVYCRHDGEEARLLAAAHGNSIALAAELGLKTLAFPAISCGVYGYPMEEAAPIAISATMDALDTCEVELVRFCFVGDLERDVFTAALARARDRGER